MTTPHENQPPQEGRPQQPTSLAELFGQLVELKTVPVPPMLEQALDYPGHASPAARFVNFYYTPYGDEGMYDDGRESGTSDPWAFLAFVQHNAVWPHLVAFDFGSSDAEGKHRLLLDRETRKLYAGPNRIVSQIVTTQWRRDTTTESEIPNLSVEELEAVMRELDVRMSRLPTNEEIMAVMQERNHLLSELDSWLNQNTGKEK